MRIKSLLCFPSANIFTGTSNTFAGPASELEDDDPTAFEVILLRLGVLAFDPDELEVVLDDEEPDEEERGDAGELPADEQQEQVVGQDQPEHGGDEGQ